MKRNSLLEMLPLQIQSRERAVKCGSPSLFDPWLNSDALRSESVQMIVIYNVSTGIVLDESSQSSLLMSALTAPKDLYRAVIQAVKKNYVQANWGRIQEAGEEDYLCLFKKRYQLDWVSELGHSVSATVEQVADFLANAPPPLMRRLDAELALRDVGETKKRALRFLTQETVDAPATILERFEGFVDQIDGDTAFVTLKSEFGDTLFGEYSAAKLANERIFEGRRFKCTTIDIGGKVIVRLESVPDVEITADRARAIRDAVELALGSDNDDAEF